MNTVAIARGTGGKLVVVGASDDPVTVTTGDLIGRGIQILGSSMRHPPRSNAWAGQARFRMVLVP